MIDDKNINNRPKGMIFIAAILLVYLYPIARFNAYIPYIIIGLLFIFTVGKNNFKINFHNCFFLISIYVIVSNLVIYSLMFNASIVSAISTSVFFLVPFFSVQIGNCIGTQIKKFPFEMVAFILICLEGLVVLIQNVGGSIGLQLTQMYGGDKYSLIYAVVGHRIRCVGTLGNPNALGIASLIFMSIVLCKSRNRIVKTFTLIITSAIILMSMSRTAFVLELIVLVVIYGSFFNRNVSNAKKLRNILIVAAVIYFLFMFYSSLVSRNLSADAFNDRIEIWNRLFGEIKGGTATQRTIGTVFGFGVSHVKDLGAVDNEYIYMLASTGVIGMVIWLFSIAQLAGRLRIFNDENKSVCVCLLVLWLVSSITGSFFTVYSLSFITFLFWGYSTAVGKVDNKDTRYYREITG